MLKNQAAKKRIANATEVRLDKNDLPVKISFEKGTRINSNDSFDKILGLPTHKQLIQKKSFKDKLGYQHIRLQETYEGLEVLGSQYIVHQKGNQLISANGKIRSSISVSTQPAISETTALQNALKHVNATQYMWQSSDSEKFIKNEKRDQKATFYPKGTLAISSKNYKNEESEKLVYQFDIYASVPLSRRLVEVDAHSGEVVNDISRIHTTEASGTGQSLYDGVVDLTLDLDGSAYGLADNSRGGGIYTFDLMNGTNYSSAVLISEDDNFVNESDNQAGVSAQFGAAATYDYFFNNFGRDSYDDDDASIYSYVHYSSGYFNAFWDGSRMTYGDGDGVSATALVSLDIVGHEIAHAVTEHSAGLVYSYESGALNESFSDIFGQSIEFENFPETASWNLADQIYTDGTSMIRSMSNPNDQGQPDTYLGDLWYSGSGDNGGVHYNSGVQNFWYYLIVEGGTGTNDIGYTYDVSAIGLEAAQQIAYRNLTTYLTSTSQYIDARAGAEQAAIDLYGEESTEYESVVEAWNAVGVPSADPVLSVTDDIAYNDVPLGYTQIIEVDILNQGNGLLTINNIEFNHADFSTSETTLSLGSLESTTLEFGFTPSELGEINAEATITSNGGDAVISISGTGVEPPVISVTPESLEADLFSGETSEQTLTIENTGTSSLTWQMSVGEYGETATYKANKQFAGYSYFEDEHNQGNRSNGPIPMTTMASMTGNTEILVWTYYADMSTEYPNTLNAISQYYEDYTITETDVTDASELEALLADKDVFLLPEQESGSTSFYENLGTAWASALETFVNGGGNIVLCGTGTGAHLIFSQFIEMSIEDIISGESMSVLDATNPLTLDLESTIIAQDATFLVSTTDEDAIVAVEYGSYVAVLSKAIDNGNFIYVGYDFYAYDDDAAKIISNAVQYGGSPAWLDIDISSGSIAAGESQEIVVVADAADLYGGTYTVDIVVESNDPENPSINIPYTLEVTGAPNIELDTDEIDFVDAYVNIENHLTINISNNGTDQLDVTAINSSNEVFTTDLTTFSLDPSESIEVTITYLPESVGTHSEQLTILSNDAGDPELIVALTGNAVEPPVISVSPESISDDLYTGESSNHAIEIDNT
ncbi:M4 family metallopeptidase, partial [Reichenbachiella faecimaris]|uniref:M4 family metallopeptidase n=1 Tax=Reichenbachiella faecimaris TaxID=692418 RepID=UPI0015935C1B